jgi:4-hydroxythreonine-4-phosphate dehydrogenase
MTGAQPPAIGISLGDPAGIGPEVVLRALAARRSGPLSGAVRVYGPVQVLRDRARRFALPLPDEASVELIDIEGEAPPLGAVSASGGHLAVGAVRAAARDALAGAIQAVVTGPLNKASLRAAGYPWPGHTELLAAESDSPDVAMMFVGGTLRVALVSIHQSLASVPESLDAESIVRIVRLVHRELPKFGGGARRIAMCGLNPHAGEGGLFGDEDTRVIAPAVARLRSEGIDVSDPLPADTVFVRAAAGEFDAVVAQYHDQGLIPVKLASFGHAVNVTLGLPFIRTSVDHGTGFDIVERGIADPGSLIAALDLAEALARSSS